MATFDQLPAEQRAILELVVGRGQTYEELSGMLGMPASRVRELAREALGDLAPATASRVDSDWRGQIADYVLGQQSGPESTATKGHFKRSEPARAWAYSLLDSLGHLYPNGTMPEIPAADGSAPTSAPAAERPGGTPPAPHTRHPAPDTQTPEHETRDPTPTAATPSRARPQRTGLSPDAQAIVRRRRIIGGAVAAAVLVLVILLIAGVFSGGGNDNSTASSTSTSTSTSAGGTPRPLSEGVLRPVSGQKGAGIAFVLQQGNQRQLVITATRLQPTDQRTAYDVWLYNSPSDSVSLGAQFTDQQGNLQGRGSVPANWQHFNQVVLSRERVGTNPKAPSNLVLRARMTAVPAGAQNGTTGTTGG